MRVFDNSAESILEVGQLLLRGEVVAIPTETVYGLAADALNVAAVESIYQIKNRPEYNPLIIHVHDLESAEKCTHLNLLAKKLIDAFWPGPLTLVLKKKSIIPSIVSAGLNTVGIRMPNHAVMRSVLKYVQRPLAAPSANPSNYISPTTVDHVKRGLDGRLQYAIDGGSCESGLESTIVDLSKEGEVTLLRPGPISKAELEQVLQLSVIGGQTHSTPESPNSPGQLKTHYSPDTKLIISDSIPDCSKLALIRFSKKETEISTDIDVYYLSEDCCVQEVEKNLYALLQQLDQLTYDMIVVEPVPEGQEWQAVRDRLNRASAK